MPTPVIGAAFAPSTGRRPCLCARPSWKTPSASPCAPSCATIRCCEALQGFFLTRDNTKFLVLHQHEVLPHGNQILNVIEEGARKGTVLYLRMAEWAIRPTTLASICDRGTISLDQQEEQRIASFSMAELAGGNPPAGLQQPMS